MNLFCFIGNLGADCKAQQKNGRDFITFNVGDNRKWADEAGTTHEETTWVSCVMNGRNENLLPYLVKGAQVAVYGRVSTRVFSSPKEKRMVAGLNLQVDHLELIGRRPDDVPSMLYDANGIGYNIYKAYYVHPELLSRLGATEKAPAVLMTPDMKQFQIDVHGWVTPIKTQEENQQANDTNQQ